METEFIIRTLFKAYEKGNYVVGPSHLSKELDIPKSTAQKILIQLSELGYGFYVERKGFIFSEKGLREGKRILRRHRLLECLLEDLGMDKSEICEEASKIDLAFGSGLERLIEEKYGKKERCPCGKPIPSL
ncbi:MAG: DtxR family transcriptional regulator, Mn-dependent transcriptional regulator [Archaeoglobaceae archaeon]|nr:DtxR family transcriptional regulator, Mn-dependent transcriptional regulator [Archaeoglobaceae archaeon]MDK2876667.1 DtxR family transcriptional regulator, Mn-dependent transcriptional regulator [Archaeoglobaceae archaeon]